MTKMKPPEVKNWEEEFDNFAKDCFTHFGGEGDEYNFYLYEIDEYNKLKSFIRNLLTQTAEEARRETEKAFGGCVKCYGKGYSTQMVQERGADDFGNEGYVKAPEVQMNFCSCDRGKALSALLSQREKEILELNDCHCPHLENCHKNNP